MASKASIATFIPMTLRDTCPTAAKIDLRRRRVDRPRVIGPVDQRVDRRVAQARERRIGRARSDRG